MTGVAGPDPQGGHPVGEVHIAVSGQSRTVSSPAAEILADAANDDGAAPTTQFALIPGENEPVRVLVGERQEIRELAVSAAILAVLHEIEREEDHGNREQNGRENR